MGVLLSKWMPMGTHKGRPYRKSVQTTENAYALPCNSETVHSLLA
jgi:hypothetical protein